MLGKNNWQKKSIKKFLLKNAAGKMVSIVKPYI